jgi:hypothetical protein
MPPAGVYITYSELFDRKASAAELVSLLETPVVRKNPYGQKSQTL